MKRAGGIPEVIEVAKERPLSTTAGLVGGITGGLAVGGARFGKLNIDRLKINRAIDNAILIPKRAGITIEKAIKKYKIDKNEIPEIKELASRSVEIREVTVKLKGITPEDRKLIPKVEGKFLEFIGSDGRIIEVVSLGKIGFELKGKVYSRDVLQRAGGRLDEANREIFVRTISAKPDIRKGFKN